MKKIKIGIFGLGRGTSFFKSAMLNDGEIVAFCDKDAALMEREAKNLPDTPVMYTNFDEFIEHDMDAVVLCNYFTEHAPYAVKALERNIHVLCECISNGTMAEGVELVRAAEKSSAYFMLAENYPFMIFNQEIKRVYDEGTLGKAIYAEGEYNHPFNGDDKEAHLRWHPYPQHWRNYLTRTYYITHSLAPLMYVTGATPVRVTAMPSFEPFNEFEHISSMVGDRVAIITCLNDDNSVFKVTGCAALGAASNSYRVCGTKGQIENMRGTDNRIMLRYNGWDVPEGKEKENEYKAEWQAESDGAMAAQAGHGGADFFVMKEFLSCIREGRKPVFDEYFSTTCSSVGILGHRSMLEKGVPYDIPDFHREEDRVKYENDRLTPFYVNGEAPTLPCCSVPDFKPDPVKYQNYIDWVEEKQKSKE